MNEKRRLKIGIDYHGVIDRDPDYFREFSRELIRRGHEVHIVTGGPCGTVTETLRKLRFCYTQSFAVLDHYEAEGLVKHETDGGFRVADELWNSAKAEYCRAQGIDLHIDDSLEYLRYFVTPYCRYDERTHRCTLNDEPCLDFNLAPKQVVAHLEKIFSK